MTRLGIISDIHGDYAALEDALAQLDRMCVSEIVCAGDVLDYGPSPVRCIELLQSRGIPCVRGNHDFLDVGGELFELSRFMPPPAIAWIVDLPTSWERDLDGVHVAVWHGRPGTDDRDVFGRRDERGADGGSPPRACSSMFQGIIPELADVEALLWAARADVLVVGHTHVPMDLDSAIGAIVNPGSILRQPPRTEQLPASGTFGVLELPSCRFTVHRASDGAEVAPRTRPYPSGSYP
jgi:predicted phosphodiesterase